VIAQFAEDIAKGDSPILYGDGSQTRDFTHVSDAVSAAVAAAENRLDGVYNVGTGTRHSFDEVVASINRELGTDVDPEYVENPIPESVYVHDTCADASKLRAATGWEPEIGLEEGSRWCVGRTDGPEVPIRVRTRPNRRRGGRRSARNPDVRGDDREVLGAGRRGDVDIVEVVEAVAARPQRRDHRRRGRGDRPGDRVDIEPREEPIEVVGRRVVAVGPPVVLEVDAEPEFGHRDDADRVSSLVVEACDPPVDAAAVDVGQDGRVTDLHRSVDPPSRRSIGRSRREPPRASPDRGFLAR